MRLASLLLVGFVTAMSRPHREEDPHGQRIRRDVEDILSRPDSMGKSGPEAHSDNQNPSNESEAVDNLPVFRSHSDTVQRQKSRRRPSLRARNNSKYEVDRPWHLTEQEEQDHMLSWHKERLQAYADKHKIFLIIRTPEVETVRRMKEMFFKSRAKGPPFRDCPHVPIQAKGLDVHHKSSNWGPMTGFVTVDPFFSKGVAKVKGPHVDAEDLAKRVISDHFEHLEDDGVETSSGWGIVQLTMAFANDASGGRQLDHLPPNMEYCADTLKNPCGPNYFCIRDTKGDVPQKKLVVFCVDKRSGKVTWLRARHEATQEKVPLYVFAYGVAEAADISATGQPVTGDYDLWLTAYSPHSDILMIPDEEKMFRAPTYEEVYGSDERIFKTGIGHASAIEFRLVSDDINDSSFNLNQAAIGNKEDRCNVFLHPSEMFNEAFMQDVPNRFIFIVPAELQDKLHWLHRPSNDDAREMEPAAGVNITHVLHSYQRVPGPFTSAVRYIPSLPKLGLMETILKRHPRESDRKVKVENIPDFRVMGHLLFQLVQQRYIFPINTNYATDPAIVISRYNLGVDESEYRLVQALSTQLIFKTLSLLLDEYQLKIEAATLTRRGPKTFGITLPWIHFVQTVMVHKVAVGLDDLPPALDSTLLNRMWHFYFCSSGPLNSELCKDPSDRVGLLDKWISDLSRPKSVSPLPDSGGSNQEF